MGKNKLRLLSLLFLILPISKIYSVNITGQALVNSAENYLNRGITYDYGTPDETNEDTFGYIFKPWDGKSLDCSGLVDMASGLRRHYSAWHLKEKLTIPVAWWQGIYPGDLLITYNDPKYGGKHVRIFIGWYETYKVASVIEASGSKHGVAISTYSITSELIGYTWHRLIYDNVEPTIKDISVENDKTYKNPVTVSFTAIDDIYTSGEPEPRAFARDKATGERFRKGKSYTDPGEYEVDFYASDWAGNFNLKTVKFTIEDDEPPEPPPSPNGETANGMFRPRDPNVMYGPKGYVYAGQTLNYTVEFENIGEGIAYGVYVTNVLPEGLDDTSLVVSNFKRKDYTNNTETPSNFEYRYDSKTRMLTVFIDNYGEVGSKQGGKFDLSVRVKSDAQPETVITNYATVYFPSVCEETRTNSVVSVIPHQTQIVYSGQNNVKYSDSLKLQALLTTENGKKISYNPITFTIGNSSYTVITSSEGVASIDITASQPSGEYTMNIEYYGDGFYHLPSSDSVKLTIEKKNIVLSNLSAIISYPSTGTAYATMFDSDEEPLIPNGDIPILHLEYYDGENWILLGNSPLSVYEAMFEFTLPKKPTKNQLDIRVRFEGNDRYNSGYSTGTLNIIDENPPEITISSPVGGERFIATVSTITINYTVTDNLDPVPTYYAYLTDLEEGTTIQVNSGRMIEPLSIDDGFWTLTVEATDWVGNHSSTTTAKFEVIHDIQPPRTEVAVHSPKFIVDSKTYITSLTDISLSAIDDIIEVGDGRGLGVKETKFRVDSSEFIVYTGTFTIPTESSHTITYYSVDVIGNTEQPKTLEVIVDNTPPESQLIVHSPKFIDNGKVFVSSETAVSLVSVDRSTIPCEVKYTEYKIDDSFYSIYISTFYLSALPEGEHTIYYRSYDNLLNQETERSVKVIIDNSISETFVSIAQPKYNDYITSESAFTLIAIDSGTIPSGIKETKYTIYTSTNNIPAYTQYVTTFNITGMDGIYSMNYYSQDNVENTEPTRDLTLKLDNTKPQSQITENGLKYISSDNKTYITSQTNIVFTTQDPIINEVASGIKQVSYTIDSGQIITYATPFILSEGIHAIGYYSTDNLGNTEQINQKTYYVDNTAPVTEILFNNKQQSGQETIIAPDTILSFTATDPLSSGIASGVNKTHYRIDTSTNYAEYVNAFTLPSGEHTIEYYTNDNVGNSEQTKTMNVTVTILQKYTLIGSEEINITGKVNIKGDIRSNGEITIKGKPVITGNIYGDKVKISRSSTINGTITENASKIDPYPINLTQIINKAATQNNNVDIGLTQKGKKPIDKKGRLVITGNDSLTMSTGTYYFTGIQLTGKSEIKLQGKVKIVCIGDIKLVGNVKVNANGVPATGSLAGDKVKNFVIYVSTYIQERHWYEDILDDIECNNFTIDNTFNNEELSEIFEDKDITFDDELGIDKKGNINCRRDKTTKVPQVLIGGKAEYNGIIYAPKSKTLVAGNYTFSGNIFCRQFNATGKGTISITANSVQPFAAVKLAPSSAFVLGEIYSYPNPAKNGKTPTIHIECGIADKIEIKIYNIAAEHVHSVELNGTQPLTINSKYCYEYNWDISNVASGVYIYVIRAKKAGYPDIKATGKAAVVR
ncbi:MAG: hypothetical protein PHE88_04545 [Elusimicrobia bacterium]|nr:hypothetical protein [Elusimicrobiota bacterium]